MTYFGGLLCNCTCTYPN